MGPVNTPKPRVAVEYTSRGRRVEKVFDDAFEARRFYCAKSKAGACPAVKRTSN